MHRLRTLSFLVIAFSILGAASAVLAIATKFVGKEAGSEIPIYLLLLFQGVLMGAIAAVGSIVSGMLKALADRIDALERRTQESTRLPDDRVRS